MSFDPTTASYTAAQRIIENTPDLPTAPPVIFKLMTLLKKTVQHNEDVVEIIRYDENLTAKLLKLCNTAFFKTTNPVSSVDQVVLRLGYSNILSIAVSLRVGDIVSKTKKASFTNPYDLWRHSVTSAIAARFLSESCRTFDIPSDIAFTGGLLLEIGKVALNGCTLEEVQSIKPLAQEKNIPLEEAEREILGTDHAEIGGLLLSKWNLPDDIVDAVSHHQSPDLSRHPLAYLCNVAHACAIANTEFLSPEETLSLIHPETLPHLGFLEQNVYNALQHIKDEAAKIETFMMVA